MDLSLLFVEWLETPLWMWSSFFVLVIAILSFDLGILHKQNKEIGVRESVKLSALYIEKFPAALSRGVTFAIIAAGVVWSLMKTRDQQQPA